MAIFGLFGATETLPREKRKSVDAFFNICRPSKRRCEVVAHEKNASFLDLALDKRARYILMLWSGMLVRPSLTAYRTKNLTDGVVLVLQLMLFMLISAEVLFYYTSTQLGGLGLTTKQMSFVFGLRPVAVISIEMVVYPRFAKRYGPEAVFRYCSFGYILLFLSYFALGDLASRGLPKVWTFVGIGANTLIFGMSNPMLLACGQLIPARAPSQMHLTRMNTASEICSSLGRALGALAGSNLFSFCVRYSVFGGAQGVWVLGACIAAVFCACAQRITEGDGWRDQLEQEQELANDS